MVSEYYMMKMDEYYNCLDSYLVDEINHANEIKDCYIGINGEDLFIIGAKGEIYDCFAN